jgi:hypothetical protein
LIFRNADIAHSAQAHMWRLLQPVILVEAMMRRAVRGLLLSGLIVVGAWARTPVQSAPLPVGSGDLIAGDKPVEQVWHHGGWGGGAVLAGAAIGLFAGAALASAYRPYYYGYGYYPAYYSYPAYYPYHYRPVYYARPYYYRPYWGYRRAYYARPYWGYRRAYYARPYWGYRRAYYARPYVGYRRAYWRGHRVAYRRAYVARRWR